MISANAIMEALARKTATSKWHDEVPSGLPFDYYYHASSLAHCVRQQTLERAGLATDPRTLSSSMNLTLGTKAHEAILTDGLDQYLYEHPEVKLLYREQGFYHPQIPLAAKPDAVLRLEDGRVIIVDLKTEHEDGHKRRQAEAKAKGWKSAARWEHMIQLTATAMTIEANVPGLVIDAGYVYYATKSQWWVSEEKVDVQDSNLRAVVVDTVHELRRAHETYTASGALPKRLAEGSWECAVQKENPPCGKWCAARSNCFRVKD